MKAYDAISSRIIAMVCIASTLGLAHGYELATHAMMSNAAVSRSGFGVEAVTLAKSQGLSSLYEHLGILGWTASFPDSPFSIQVPSSSLSPAHA